VRAPDQLAVGADFAIVAFLINASLSITWYRQLLVAVIKVADYDAAFTSALASSNAGTTSRWPGLFVRVRT
jgi:hypothetical protein